MFSFLTSERRLQLYYPFMYVCMYVGVFDFWHRMIFPGFSYKSVIRSSYYFVLIGEDFCGLSEHFLKIK